jgi:hypothetical protein
VYVLTEETQNGMSKWKQRWAAGLSGGLDAVSGNGSSVCWRALREEDARLTQRFCKQV